MRSPKTESPSIWSMEHTTEVFNACNNGVDSERSGQSKVEVELGGPVDTFGLSSSR